MELYRYGEKNQKISNGVNVEINNKTKNEIDLALVKRVGEKFLESYRKRNYSVSIAFVGDKKIWELNRKYRGVDKITDVLSFTGEGNFLGEIVIDYNQVKRQTYKLRGQGPKAINEELVFILAHGLLHLLGYDDKSEKGRLEMIRLGEKFLKISNFFGQRLHARGRQGSQPEADQPLAGATGSGGNSPNN